MVSTYKLAIYYCLFINLGEYFSSASVSATLLSCLRKFPGSDAWRQMKIETYLSGVGGLKQKDITWHGITLIANRWSCTGWLTAGILGLQYYLKQGSLQCMFISAGLHQLAGLCLLHHPLNLVLKCVELFLLLWKLSNGHWWRHIYSFLESLCSQLLFSTKSQA